jgi:hypothetical protein
MTGECASVRVVGEMGWGWGRTMNEQPATIEYRSCNPSAATEHCINASNVSGGRWWNIEMKCWENDSMQEKNPWTISGF